MKKLLINKGLGIGVLSIVLIGCKNEQSQTAQQSVENNKTTALEVAFKQWKAQQNPQDIERYQSFLASKLKNPPDLFTLSYNIHIQDQACLAYRFALAPESQWKNIVAPLQLLEKLKADNIIENYKIVSIYRGKDANTCSRGAKFSKHLSNYAVDFQVFDQNGQHYAKDDVRIRQQLCQYWQKYGKQLKLGLGTYGSYKFHIDVQGFRTWGWDYKRASSACLEVS